MSKKSVFHLVARRLGIGRKLDAIEELANTRGATGGLVKRIDENRELMELLRKAAPAFLGEHAWVEGWVKANDEFFVRLDEIVASKGRDARRPDFPRPWPARVESFHRRPVALGERDARD